MALVALLVVGLLPITLLFLRVLLHHKVTDIASLAEESLYLDRLPELGGVLCVRGSSGRGPARELDLVLLVDVLSHLRATCADKAADCAIGITVAVTAAGAAADAEERILRRLQRVDRRAMRCRQSDVCGRHAMQMLVQGKELSPLRYRRVRVMALKVFV